MDSLSAGVRGGCVLVVCDDTAGAHSDNILDVPRLLEGMELPWRKAEPAHLSRQVREAFQRSEELELPVALLVDAEAMAETTEYVPSPASEGAQGFERNIRQHLLCPMLAAYQRQVLRAKLSGQDWRALPPPALPRIPEGLPAAWQEKVRPYEPFFEVFRTVRGSVVVGDTGVSSLFAFAPYECIDICTYMGGSIPLAVGAYLGGHRDVWAVSGDFSFVAAGHLGLIEALNRGIPLKVIVLNNHQAQTTGGQAVRENVLETVLKGYAPWRVTIADPQDRAEVEAVLREAHGAETLRIVVADFRRAQSAS